MVKNMIKKYSILLLLVCSISFGLSYSAESKVASDSEVLSWTDNCLEKLKPIQNMKSLADWEKNQAIIREFEEWVNRSNMTKQIKSTALVVLYSHAFGFWSNMSFAVDMNNLLAIKQKRKLTHEEEEHLNKALMHGSGMNTSGVTIERIEKEMDIISDKISKIKSELLNKN